jgi:hypothetical protein
VSNNDYLVGSCRRSIKKKYLIFSEAWIAIVKVRG